MTGPEIRAWRERWGLTRRDLAEIFEISEYTLYRWEHGERQPGTGCILDFALEALELRLSRGMDTASGARLDWAISDVVPNTSRTK